MTVSYVPLTTLNICLKDYETVDTLSNLLPDMLCFYLMKNKLGLDPIKVFPAWNIVKSVKGDACLQMGSRPLPGS